jgi:alkanesulfonate monooxygenase SsuD/methylene tetrahydromethanopterin reductase-like flavin-dependent oxidoreductase (luciferase family)
MGAIRLGWWLSSEEHDPLQLVEQAALAERVGFPTATISDHLQPWSLGQGHARYVWTTLGAIAHATERLEVGTGVTAMIHRSHPIVVAHAAATATLIDAYRGAGGDGPCLAQLHISLAASTDTAVSNAWQWWPNGAVAPAVLAELARPQHFEAIAEQASREAIHDTVVCATGAEPIVRAIDRLVGAGFDTVYLHQIGPDQQRLAELARTELLPHYDLA